METAETRNDRRWWILAVLCLSVLLTVVDNTIVNVALPSISRDLHASTGDLQWVVDGYTLSFAGLLLLGGNLGDRLGRRRLLQVGLALFALFSVGAALATSTSELIAARAAMGVAAALVYPATLAILNSVFTNPRERATAIGIWSAVSGLAVAIGPVVGGALLVHFSWSSVFYVSVPVAVIALIGGRLVLPESRDPNAGRFDPFGALLSIVGDRAAHLVDHRGAQPRLGIRGDRRRDRRVAGGAGGLRLVAGAAAGPDARRATVPQPSVRRGERGDRAGVLRAVRVHLHDHPVLPDRPRVLAAARRAGDAAVRVRHRGVLAGGDDRHEAARHQGRRRVRPPADGRRPPRRGHHPDRRLLLGPHRPRDGADGGRARVHHRARPPTRSWARCPPARPARAPPSTTRHARSAARSGSRSSARCSTPPTARTCCTASSHSGRRPRSGGLPGSRSWPA